MADLERGLNPPSVFFRAPTENVDGTPVSGPLTYTVYRKAADVDVFTDPYLVLPPTLQEVDGVYEAQLSDFPPGRHIIGLTATDVDLEESTMSLTMGFRITDGVPPNPPELLP